MRTFILMIGCFFILLSCPDAADPTAVDDSDPATAPPYHLGIPEFSGTKNSSDPAKAFSEIVRVGELYFLSGQIGKDPETNQLVTGGIEAETRQTLENIQRVLDRNGISMSSVVKATVILDDIADFSAFNTIFMEYFPQKPARTTFAAEELAKGAKIEIEVVAVHKPGI